MKRKIVRFKKNPMDLVVMGANPSSEREIILPPGASISITIRVDSPDEARRRQNSLSGFLFGPRYSREEQLELGRIGTPSHTMELLAKAGGDMKKMAKMARQEIEDIQSGRWTRRQRGEE